MRQQLDLFQAATARDKAIDRVEQSANAQIPGWSNKAYYFLRQFIRSKEIFTIEEVRQASIGYVPEAKEQRAWGAIAARAKKQGLIKRISYAKSTNPKAHCRPVSVWQRIS